MFEDSFNCFKWETMVTDHFLNPHHQNATYEMYNPVVLYVDEKNYIIENLQPTSFDKWMI